MSQYIPLFALLFVFLLIAFRRIGSLRLQIWQIMLAGALIVLVTGSISFGDAFNAINYDVILFLFGMFVIGEALEESGYLSHLSYKLFRRTKSIDSLILFILFGFGLASAFLMNDTCAIIGAPVVIALAKKHHFPAKIMLLCLAFAVTLGSVPSPIGNPQNLLIALAGGEWNSFITFAQYLLIPTILNLFFTYILLKIYFGRDFHKHKLVHEDAPLRDGRLAIVSKISLVLLILMIALKMLSTIIPFGIDIRLTYIALVSALPIILFSNSRIQILRKIDWSTLVFFAAMFILMESVWDTNFFQPLITDSGADITSTPTILLVSIVVSQFISNVPLTALYLPILAHAGAGAKELVALAAGSTIAGNLFILGAASNVIIIQNAEKKAGETLTFMDFARIGIPLTIINAIVYWVFLGVL
jgi:Na+/H+ antiporter NhaD/arsenite permease-like protein